MNSVDVKMDGLSVMVGIPAGRDIPPLTVKSLLGTFNRCQKMSIHCELGMVANCSIITKARDEVVDLFMASEANRLFWIDSDMVWDTDQFMRILALSKLYPVVCAAYAAKIDQPTFYVKYDTENGLRKDEYGMVEVQGLGLGFACIQREVMEKIVENSPVMHDEMTNKDISSVFRVDTFEGKFRGEDMAFFADIRNLGYKVMLDPMTDLGHIGTKQYSGKFSDLLS